MDNDSNIDTAFTPWSRHYRQVREGIAQVTIDRLIVEVPDHPFWEKFARGWEPDTERTFRAQVRPGSTVIDIGAWIGPTVLYALACGAEKVVAVEPNPQSISRLEQMIALNPRTMGGVTLIDQAIGSRPGPLALGQAKGESDTSMFGIAGNDLQVEATTLGALLANQGQDNVDLIKIDVEGAEVMLLEELHALSSKYSSVVHLSIHVPFFPAGTDQSRAAAALERFKAFDDRGEPLSQGALKQRLTSTQMHPPWGTQHGNFFELILFPR